MEWANVEARRGRDWERLLADLDAARSRHEAAVRAVPLEAYALQREMGPYSPFANDAQHFAAIVARHERGHIADIVSWLGSLGEGPAA